MKECSIDIILIVDDFTLGSVPFIEPHLEAIRKAAPGAELIIIRNPEEWRERSEEIASRVQVVFGRRPATWFHEMPNLRWVQQTGAGADWLFRSPEIVESDLILTNASGIQAIPISEHVMAFMLILSRGIHRHIRSQMKRTWDRSGAVAELEGATVGLIGVGRIGAKTAEKAKRMNMRVLGLRRHPERTVPDVDRMYGADGLMELLRQSDWVVLAAALTAETRGMIGEGELKAMKKSAYLINIARGSLIQEEALIKALREGWIAGAGLDVFEQEPLGADSPLWDMENVVITPHYSHASPRKMDRQVAIFVENLRRYQSGQPLINVVNKRLGY